MKTRHLRRTIGMGAALIGAAFMMVSSLGVTGCASAKRNPDERPGLRKRADESQRDFERTIENNRKDHREKN